MRAPRHLTRACLRRSRCTGLSWCIMHGSGRAWPRLVAAQPELPARSRRCFGAFLHCYTVRCPPADNRTSLLSGAGPQAASQPPSIENRGNQNGKAPVPPARGRLPDRGRSRKSYFEHTCLGRGASDTHELTRPQAAAAAHTAPACSHPRAASRAGHPQQACWGAAPRAGMPPASPVRGRAGLDGALRVHGCASGRPLPHRLPVHADTGRTEQPGDRTASTGEQTASELGCEDIRSTRSPWPTLVA